MKLKKKTVVKVIDCQDAEDFEEALNGLIEDIHDPDITFHQGKPFLAYVKYIETVEIPTTLQEAYEMRGDVHFCGECPYYIKPENGRRKVSRCEVGETCMEDQPACNLFYKMLNEGTLDKPKKVIRR